MKKLLCALSIVLCSASFASELPEQYKTLDSNGNEFIDIKEVEGVIDSFFTTGGQFDVDFIHGLIDFFFDQPKQDWEK